MRVCLDTNILASAFFFDGNEQRVLKLAIDGKYELILSNWILFELEKVLRRMGVSARATWAYLVRLKRTSKVVRPVVKGLKNKIRDPPDRKVAGTAVAGICDYLVTGDKELLELAEIEGVKIVKSRQLLLVLG
jgi:putative PIN family toxin of toxin-antitoxin system